MLNPKFHEVRQNPEKLQMGINAYMKGWICDFANYSQSEDLLRI